MDFTKCTESKNDIEIIAEEKQRKFIIHNPHKIKIDKIKVDGCLITNNLEKACDYMFEINKPVSDIIYLELKGKNIERAFKQLKVTMTKFTERHKKIPKICCIVTSRTPAFATKETEIFLNSFKNIKPYLKIKIKSGVLPINIYVDKETQKLEIKY